MEIEKKLELNKKIRKYDGSNTFIISLQKQLRSNKITPLEYNGKKIKLLSEKQYIVANELLQ